MHDVMTITIMITTTTIMIIITIIIIITTVIIIIIMKKIVLTITITKPVPARVRCVWSYMTCYWASAAFETLHIMLLVQHQI